MSCFMSLFCVISFLRILLLNNKLKSNYGDAGEKHTSISLYYSFVGVMVGGGYWSFKYDERTAYCDGVDGLFSSISVITSVVISIASRRITNCFK